MIAKIDINNETIKVDLSKPIDISIPYDSQKGATAWYVPPVKIEPVMTEHFTGSVAKGGSVNFRNISFNPHGHGTHTECVGHISEEIHSVNNSFSQFHFLAEVISISPENCENPEEFQDKGDFIITASALKTALHGAKPEALVIRTIPNDLEKKERAYSETNWPYLTKNAMQFIRNIGINHLLIDLPSVDKENDGGKLNAHHIFWEHPENTNLQRTITELIYVPEQVLDGTYFLEMQVAPFVNDAAPSRPVLYPLLP